MVLEENYTLNNGVEIPKLGLGTWFINNTNVVGAVKSAIDLGYRHIDTAQAYRNEAGVGEGVRASGAKREDIFVTSKVDAGAKSYARAAKSIDRTLKATGLDYIDMMIIHSPQPWTSFRGEKRFFDENREVWRALEDATKAGKVRAIGLSNFEKDDLDNILEVATVQPAVNQVLAHIGNTPFELIEYTQSKGILVEAYSPVAHGALLNNEAVKAIAAKYDVSVPQLSIRYCLQLGLLPLPKTANPAHMKSNAELDFVISDEDMETLNNVEPVTDYGDANMMPVYGGKMNLGTIFKMIFSSNRG
ncbi:aldo/keto reductase [Demequina zhanjiangensis]|uniref:Aldo/keto reductase n=1 Tax=Demequina zhanjiangensis TaxID=3051659 RepID=A0ABT8G0B1_9MICO|nr:aldo/keto reductase [Demequina sp. SYSU T00b26]MDN4472581.1 aldo/keto reductase [Demequina sp. SYSU T00b26]